MAARVSILVQVHPADSNNWRKFVAALCFIEFYTHFVTHGQQIASLIRNNRPGPWDDHIFYALLHGVAAMLRAIMLFGLGRALWRGNQWVTYWLLRAIGLSAACIAISAVAAMTESPARGPYVWTGSYSWTDLGSPPLKAMFRNAEHLPWLGILIAGIWYARRHNVRWRRTQPWVVLAAIWCFCIAPVFFVENVFYRGAYLQYVWWSGWLYVFLQLATGGALLLHWRYARTLALTVFGSELVSISLGLWCLPTLVYCAVRMLRISHGLGGDLSPWMFILWNDLSFPLLFVYSVALAGPWVLIAIYAWRVPMRVLPEDGSPYPRRYCGRCSYNLHGIDSPRCPECGSELSLNHEGRSERARAESPCSLCR